MNTSLQFNLKLNEIIKFLERFPSKPYVKEGYPGNITALVNDKVTLTCPPVSDLEPDVIWLRPTNYTSNNTEVGPSDAPVPEGVLVKVHNRLTYLEVLVTSRYDGGKPFGVKIYIVGYSYCINRLWC